MAPAGVFAINDPGDGVYSFFLDEDLTSVVASGNDLPFDVPPEIEGTEYVGPSVQDELLHLDLQWEDQEGQGPEPNPEEFDPFGFGFDMG